MTLKRRKKNSNNIYGSDKSSGDLYIHVNSGTTLKYYVDSEEYNLFNFSNSSDDLDFTPCIDDPRKYFNEIVRIMVGEEEIKLTTKQLFDLNKILEDDGLDISTIDIETCKKYLSAVLI